MNRVVIISLILFILMLPSFAWGVAVPDEIQIESVQLYQQETGTHTLWKLSITYSIKNDDGKTDGIIKTFELSDKQKDDVKAFLGGFLRELN